MKYPVIIQTQKTQIVTVYLSLKNCVKQDFKDYWSKN